MDLRDLLWGSRRKKFLLVSIGLCFAAGSFANIAPSWIEPSKNKKNTRQNEDQDKRFLVLPDSESKNNPLPSEVAKEIVQEDSKEVLLTDEPAVEEVSVSNLTPQATNKDLQAIAEPDFDSPIKTRFLPTDRDMSETEKQKLIQDIATNQAIDSPFELDEEAVAMMAQYDDEKDPAKKDHMLDVITRYPHMRKNVKNDASDATQTVSQGQSVSSKHAPVGRKIIQKGVSSYQAHPGSDVEAMQNVSHGKVVSGRIDYVRNDIALSQEQVEIYQHLRVHEIKAGKNASLLLEKYSNQKEFPTPLYATANGVEISQKIENKYRFPPDWNNRYSFSNDPSEDAKIASTTAQKLLLSLGTGGSITFEIVGGAVVNQAGPDFVIWENPFCYLKTKEGVTRTSADIRALFEGYIPDSAKSNQILDQFVECETEKARVSVSVEGPQGEFHSFEPCNRASSTSASRCAGYGLNLWDYDKAQKNVLKNGGDAFDLDQMDGIEEIRAIRIEDLGYHGPRGEAGFDLDAIAIVHFQSE
ncbi:MAG: hypothetical protein KDD46_00815 [Bdellovibrionales bacterium]|nr:hypothetical protein [Bdellovibrionales bacterium]